MITRSLLGQARRGALCVALASLGCGRSQANAVEDAAAGLPRDEGERKRDAVSGMETGAVPDSGGRAEWSGTYTSAPGSLYVPEGSEWAGLKWRGDDASDGIGTGSLTLEIDPSGRVVGTLDGAVGAAVIEGSLSDGVVAATVHRKALADRGLTGTLWAHSEGDTLEGTMKLSTADAHVLRWATFSIHKAK